MVVVLVINVLLVTIARKKVDVYFEWRLITKDQDDDKYVDAAIAGGADYIVTNDTHFKVLNSVDFPKVEAINSDRFLAMIS